PTLVAWIRRTRTNRFPLWQGWRPRARSSSPGSRSRRAPSRCSGPSAAHAPRKPGGCPSWLQIPSARRRCKTRHVIDLLRFVCGLAVDLTRRRAELVAENALLRQQVIVAERKVAGRVRWTPWQRFTIVLAARVVPAWREATLLIQPALIREMAGAQPTLGCRAHPWRVGSS